MAALLLRRALQLVVVLLIVSLLTLLMIHLLPQDPAYSILGQQATPTQVAQIHHQLGLDRPFFVQWLEWLRGLVSGDLGKSLRTNQSVTSALAERLPVSIELAVLAEILALLFAIPAGVYAAYRAGGWLDRTLSGLSSAMVALPGFVLALILVYLLGFKLKVFPTIGWVPLTQDPVQNLRHALLPAIALGAVEGAVFARVLRSDMYGTLRENFILAVRAQGMPTRSVLWRNAFRPSALSLVTLAGVSLGRLIGGTVLAENIFALPGVGQLLVQSIYSSDIKMVQGVVVVLVLGVVLINLVVDVGYLFLDPRVARVR
jgi:peptide/nickel transport system permease protein